MGHLHVEDLLSDLNSKPIEVRNIHKLKLIEIICNGVTCKPRGGQLKSLLSTHVKKVENYIIFGWILKILWNYTVIPYFSNLKFRKEKEVFFKQKRIEIINRNKSLLWCYQKKIVNIFYLTFFGNFTLSILRAIIQASIFIQKKTPFRIIYNNGSLISTSIL